MFCAFCPNACRQAFPADVTPREYLMPSAMAYLAWSTATGKRRLDDAGRRILARRDTLAACRSACPYDLDVGAAIDQALAARP